MSFKRPPSGGRILQSQVQSHQQVPRLHHPGQPPFPIHHEHLPRTVMEARQHRRHRRRLSDRDEVRLQQLADRRHRIVPEQQRRGAARPRRQGTAGAAASRHQARHAQHAHRAAVGIEHRQGRHAVPHQQGARGRQRHVGTQGRRHRPGQLAAMVQARAPLGRALFGLGEDRGQVVAADVERLAVAVERRVQVFLGEARLLLGRLCGRLHVRIGVPGQLVPDHRTEHHQYRIQSHRRQHEPEAGLVHRRSTQHRRHRHRAAGWMQAAQRGHRRDRQTARERRRDQRIARLDAGHADQRRHHIAADDGPGLGQRRCRQAEQQHGGRGHRGDQVRQRVNGGGAQRGAAGQRGEEQRDERADGGRDLAGKGGGAGGAQALQPLKQTGEHGN
ncbi:hypothetical protein MASSI9I_20060 [Massilia sp. 9I]|nr:hypothetical protein MASSI9I_20060 [Massilia sp. 9I]